jgi:hypothetical protein
LKGTKKYDSFVCASLDIYKKKNEYKNNKITTIMNCIINFLNVDENFIDKKRNRKGKEIDAVRLLNNFLNKKKNIMEL